MVSLLEKIQAEIEEEGKAEAKGYDESSGTAGSQSLTYALPYV